MLPDGFTWAPRHLAPDERDLLLDGKIVAQLLGRVRGGWTAFLDRHWPLQAPLVPRRCTSWESGIAGLEVWAAHHRERLRDEIAGRARPRYLQPQSESASDFS